MAGEKNYIRYREEIQARVLKIEGNQPLPCLFSNFPYSYPLNVL